jgi:cytochrome c oxidase assembly factor 3
MRSIEDEERELLASTGANASYGKNREVPQTSSPSALSSGIPGSTVDRSASTPLTSTSTTSSASSWLPVRWRRLNEVGWVQNAGLVESGTGNVLVWGAPNVDNIGSLGDRVDKKKGTRGL